MYTDMGAKMQYHFQGSFETVQFHVNCLLVAFSSIEGSGDPAQIRESFSLSHTHSKLFKDGDSDEDLDL